jgi:hypothetical protein
MDSVKARESAAQCWCDPTTSQIEMNTDLADIVAQAIEKAYLDGWKACVAFQNSIA